MVLEVPLLPYSTLEIIVNSLPPPSYVEVHLRGRVIETRALENVYERMGFPGATLRHVASINDVSREKVLESIRNYHKFKRSIGISPRENESEGAFPIFEKAVWNLGYPDEHERVGMELTPYGLDIHYNGKEPPYITKLREKLQGLQLRDSVHIEIENPIT